eukprot:2772845-Prorocentrum_lima.AAC.1
MEDLTASADGAAKALFKFNPPEEAWKLLCSTSKRSAACPSCMTSAWARSSPPNEGMLATQNYNTI